MYTCLSQPIGTKYWILFLFFSVNNQNVNDGICSGTRTFRLNDAVLVYFLSCTHLYLGRFEEGELTGLYMTVLGVVRGVLTVPFRVSVLRGHRDP